MFIVFLLEVNYKDGAPSDAELLRLSSQIAAKWNAIGILLGFSKHQLDSIGTNAMDKAHQMLSEWKNFTSSQSHYKDLYIALCDETVRLNNIAKEFCLE